MQPGGMEGPLLNSEQQQQQSRTQMVLAGFKLMSTQLAALGSQS